MPTQDALGKFALHGLADISFQRLASYSIEPGAKLHDRQTKVASTSIGEPVVTLPAFMGLMEFLFLVSVFSAKHSNAAHGIVTGETAAQAFSDGIISAKVPVPETGMDAKMDCEIWLTFRHENVWPEGMIQLIAQEGMDPEDDFVAGKQISESAAEDVLNEVVKKGAMPANMAGCLFGGVGGGPAAGAGCIDFDTALTICNQGLGFNPEGANIQFRHFMNMRFFIEADHDMGGDLSEEEYSAYFSNLYALPS